MRESVILRVSRYVLDSFAILAFIQKEQGWQRVGELIQNAEDGEVELCMSIINLAEVKYLIARRGRSTPQLIAALEALPVTFVSADEYVEAVIALKANYAVSIAGCFGAAIALHLNCPLVTADPEFRKLEHILQIEWLE